MQKHENGLKHGSLLIRLYPLKLHIISLFIAFTPINIIQVGTDNIVNLKNKLKERNKINLNVFQLLPFQKITTLFHTNFYNLLTLM